MDRGKISGFQFFCLFFVCRITALFTFIVPGGLSSGDRVIFLLPFCAVCLASVIPVMLVTDGGKKDIFTAAGRASPLLKRGLGIYYPALFLWTAAVSTARFELFISTVMFPGSDTGMLTLLLLAGAAAAASRGQETAGRSAVILFLLLCGSLVFILASSAGEFDVLNLSRPLADGSSPVLAAAFHSAARTTEIVSAAAASGFVKDGTRKSTIAGITAFSAAAAVIFLLTGGVTGLYGERQMFPLYTMTVIAKAGIFERMDAFLTGFWVMCAFLKAAFYIMLAVTSAQRCFNIEFGKPVYFVGAVVVFAVYRIISATTARFTDIITSSSFEYIFLFSAAALPLAVFFAIKIADRRTKQTKQPEGMR